MRASRLIAAASSCALLAGCSLLTTWDGLTSDTSGARDAGRGGAGSSSSTGGGGSGGNGGSMGDGGEDGPEDAPADAPPDVVADAPPDVVEAGSCDPMGHYCGDDEVKGDPGTLYRCNGSAPPTVLAHCLDTCLVRSGGADVCKGSGGCVAGGYYCGGDKVTGDPTALYKCTSGSSGTQIAQCATTCVVNQGTDDA